MNTCTLIGRLTSDPEIRYTPDGTPIAEFGLAVNRERNREEADFFDITVFGKTATACGNHIRKGRQVAIRGTLRQRTWTDKETNQPRSRVDVVAERVEFLAEPRTTTAPPSKASGDDGAEPF